MKDKKVYQIWLEKAEEDLMHIRAVIDEIEVYGLVCFHCQQAVEKSLKGYLSLEGIK